MSKADTWENGVLLMLFNNTPFTLVGDAGGLLASAVAGNLYVSLHDADPGEAGDQSTDEVDYTNYVRKAVARSGAGWVVTDNAVNPADPITFATGGSGTSPTATYFGIGSSSVGAGKLLYSGAITPGIICGEGITPVLTTDTEVTES